MIKNIIWDFDGTICDTYPLMVNAFIKALKSENKEVSYEKVYNLLKESSKKAFEVLDLDESFRKKWKSIEYKMDKKQAPLYDNVLKCIKYMNKNKGNNYIITHRNKTTYDFLKYHNIEKFFKDILTIEDANFRKPNEDMFNTLIKRNNIDVNKTLSVGDRILDMIPSKKVGLKTCLFNKQKNKIDINLDYTIKDYKTLLKILKEKNEKIL